LKAVYELRDLRAYVERVGLGPNPTFFELHRAHELAIPFENFDSYSGMAVSLEPEHLEDKLVARARGGYCFEHNLLLWSALASIGIVEVSPLLARVRRGEPGAPHPLNHMVLRVVADGIAWLADVGFGAGGLLDPIPMETGPEHDQSGWKYRLVDDGPELVLQAFEDDEWKEEYGFVPDPVPMVDVEVSNWFTCTHPLSPFVTGLIVGMRDVERCLAMRVDGDAALLFERPVGESSIVTELKTTEAPEVLGRRFGMEGVALGGDGQLVLTERGT
jgi:N-hydroxyarylamine O-acetyltransferase